MPLAHAPPWMLPEPGNWPSDPQMLAGRQPPAIQPAATIPPYADSRLAPLAAHHALARNQPHNTTVHKQYANLMQHAAPPPSDALSLEFVADQIRAWMQSNLLRVQDIMLLMDDDGSGCIDREEFGKAINEMGFDAPPKVMDALFKSFDQDKSKAINYQELHQLLVRSVQAHPHLEPLPNQQHRLKAKRLQKKDANLLQGIDWSAGQSAATTQIRERMKTQWMRVIDVFRQMDDDESGLIDRSEFRKAIKEMGCDAPDADIDALFRSFDFDNSKAIDYRELHSLLAHGFASKPNSAAEPQKQRRPMHGRRAESNAVMELSSLASTATLSPSLSPSVPLSPPPPLPPFFGLPGTLPPPPFPFPPPPFYALQPPLPYPPPPLPMAMPSNIYEAADPAAFNVAEWGAHPAAAPPPPQRRTRLSREPAPPKVSAMLPRMRPRTLSTESVGSTSSMATDIRGEQRRQEKHGEEFESSKAMEHEARVRLVRAQRELRRSASMNAVQELRQRNRATVEAVRADLDDRLGREVTRRIAKIEPASEAEVEELSGVFNQLIAVKDGLPVEPSWRWHSLFELMDHEGNGSVSYPEFTQMIRSELGYSGPEEKLQQLWKALDCNSSGFITEGEFGRFWRRGRATATRTRAEARAGRRRELKQLTKERHEIRDKSYMRDRAGDTAHAAALMDQRAAELEAVIENQTGTVPFDDYRDE